VATTVSLRINNDLDSRELIAVAEAAEAAGIDQLWISNDLMLHSAPAVLGAITQRTERLRIGTGIMNPYTVHPAELAMTAATLQELSGGRFLLGLAAGSAEFLNWVGIDQPTPLTTTRQALRAIRALLDGGAPVEVDGAGEGWTTDARLRFTPPSTRVPIYIGAMSPRMLAFAGAEADGVIALHLPPEHFTTARAHIAEGAASAGRTLDDLDTPACVWLSLDEDPTAAARALALKLAYYGPAFSPFLLGQLGLEPEDFVAAERHLARGDADAAADAITPTMLRMGMCGGPADVLARSRDLLALGARHLSFGPPLGPDPLASIALLGSSVLPALRAETSPDPAPIGTDS
tara:strand:- start:223718 stop:224761 length:1044 start_codon:yes stop_codon:yes gene_type:complete